MRDPRTNATVINRLAVVAAAILLIGFTAVVSEARENKTGRQYFIALSELPRRPSSVINFSQLTANGTQLGTVVLYDDPATPRQADYLEVYDSDGGLVALAWFDRYGIERMALDRAFVEGRERLDGIFVAVVDGDSM